MARKATSNLSVVCALLSVGFDTKLHITTSIEAGHSDVTSSHGVLAECSA